MIFKLKPVFFTKVWGGNKLKETYGYDCPNNTGEAWGVSGHANGSSYILNGELKGMSLRQLYRFDKSYFGNYHTKEFPILIKAINANQDLSVQVHPNDEYARIHENSLGKTECWYILDADKDTEIVIGHKAKDKEEIKEHLANNTLEKLLNRFPIKKHDLYCIYSGTIHAICSGTTLLEIQQSSDITYRLYDYNRLSNGKLRELHIEKALDVITIPGDNLTNKIPNKLFDFKVFENKDSKDHKADIYGDYIFITEGSGSFGGIEVKKGDFIFATSETLYKITGNLSYVLTNIK